MHSKKSKKSNRINDSKLKDSSNKKGSSKKKESVIGGNKFSKNGSKKGSNTYINKSKNDIENENEISESQSNDISKSSTYTIKQGSFTSSKKNSKIIKNNENKNSNLNKSNKSNNSKKSSVKERSKSSCSTIINSEIPLDDQGIKFELIKELKKIYGNKIDKALKGQNNNYSILDLIVQELKLEKNQRKKEIKQNSENKDKEKISEINIDNILLNKEFLAKYEKELQFKLQLYNQKMKKR